MTTNWRRHEVVMQLWAVKWYAAVVMLCYVGYIWLAVMGIKLTGDDNDVVKTDRAARNHSRTGNHFYHK
jgi:hypothetical protein